MSRVGRPARAALLAAALLAGCAGGPKPRTGEPPAGGTQAESGSSTTSAASGTEATAGAAAPQETTGAPEAAPATAGTAVGGSAQPAGEAPAAASGGTGTGATGSGTKIVVPTQRERRIQKAIAAAAEVVPSGGADEILEAGRELVESEAITLPEGARLAAAALSRFRELAPARAADLITIIEKAHKLLPGTADTFGALGWGYYQAGQLGPAESAAAAGLLLDATRTDLLLLRAEVLTATDRWLQAARPLELLLKAEPQNADALLLRATIMWKYERDTRGAIAIVQDAFATHPEDLRFPELQGRILYDQGQLPEARLVLNAVLARDPSRLDVVRFLLDDAVERAAWEEALLLLSRLPPPITEQDLQVAIAVARGRGDVKGAVSLAAQLDALGFDGRYTPLHVRVLLEAGDRERAISLMPPTPAPLPATMDNRVRSELYCLRALASGEPFSDAAVKDLQRALAENPSNSEAMFAMARHYFAIGQMQKAQRYAAPAVRDRPNDQALADLLAKINAALAQPGGQ